jgi:hypothetical protein
MSPVVLAAIDQAIAGLIVSRFEVDPLLADAFDPPLADAVSQVCSMTDSAKKRHGRIIEIALLSGLMTNPCFRAWSPSRFRIPPAVDHLASLLADGMKVDGAEFDYTGQGRDVQVDLMVYDQRSRLLRAYEIKRGHGRHDAQKVRGILRDLRCIQSLLVSFARANGFSASTGEARILFWYGKRSVPSPWSITGAEVDEHFGFPVADFVKEANRLFGSRLRTVLSGAVDPALLQPVLAFDGGAHV